MKKTMKKLTTKRGENKMKKLNLVLMILAMLLTVTFSAFAAIAPANVGPTTNFNGDVGVPSGLGYYIDDVLILATDSLTFTGTGTLNGLDAVDATGENTIEALIFDADAETITGNWVNTDYPWADNEVADDITAGTCSGTAGIATLVTITDNEDTVENNPLVFVANGDLDGGDLGLESDGTTYYTPSTGVITATGFAGALTGNVTGNADTVTGFTPASGSLTLSGDDAITITTTAGTSVTLPTTGILVSDATDCTDIEGDHLSITTGVLNVGDDFLLNDGDVGTGVYDFGGATSFEIPNADSSPAVTGQLILDTSVADMTNGNLAFYDGTAVRYVISLAAADIWSTDDYVVAYDADADKYYMKEDADTGGFTGNYVEHFMDVHAADADYCHAQMAGTGVLQEIDGAITSPDVPRNIVVTFGAISESTGDVTITGTLADGTTAQTETFTVADSTAVIGAKAFATVTMITIPSTIDTTTVDVGLDNLLGLSNSISAEADIYKVTLDGVDDADAVTGNGDTTNNTLDCGTIAANSDYTIWYSN